ncbi:hypothetical protein BDN72DRAFT_752819, partial [Pluteus cervinus]
LQPFKISSEEWELAEQLLSVLKTFKHATEYFSRSDADLSHVMRTMDQIDLNLTDAMNNHNINVAIRSAITYAKQTLSRYYNRTEESATYRISTILNPMFKLEYFKSRKRSEEWIAEAV